MQESERKYRNAMRLAELHPAIRPKFEAVLKEMESFGYRPRIQDAWRSQAAQLEAYNSGHSKVQYGFHNVTGPGGEKEALAADIINDNFPTDIKLDYVLHLAASAENNGLVTGIRWGLNDEDEVLIDIALMNKNWGAKLRIGWDPMHVEVTGMTIADAKAGKRPRISTGQLENPEQPQEEKPEEKEEPVSAPPRHYKVQNTGTGETHEYETTTAFKPVTLLPVPYVSQLASDASEHANDCGPACTVMLIRAYLGIPITPNEFYTRFKISGDPFLKATQLQSAMGSLGLPTDWQAGLTLGDLFIRLAESKPLIALIRYGVLRDAGLTEKDFAGPHFCVVVGIDSKYVYVHDPLYTNVANGEARAYPLSVFYKAWREVGQDPKLTNPERAALVPKMGLGMPYKQQVRVTITSLNVRSGPATTFPVISTLKKEEVVDLSRELNGWGEIAGKGWIFLTYTAVVK